MEPKELAKKQLAGCVIKNDAGIRLFTPDGEGSYGALWTRDFYYMIDDAGDLFDPEDICACLEYTLSHARETDGWIPDRVDARGKVFYTADGWDEKGEPLANLDDNDFAVLATERYRALAAPGDGDAFLHKWHALLMRALHATPVGEDGLVFNDPARPHSPYGFTDCVCKTGSLAMESLLHWQACRVAAQWGDEASEDCAARIEASFEKTFFPDGAALPLAATCDCRQTDLWAACFALSIGFPLPAERVASIRRAIASHYDAITQCGQLRHLLPGDTWAKLFIDIPEGEYQNGAYWATPLRWLTDALLPEYPALARLAVSDATEDFAERGCCECINGDYRKLPNYVASATALYAAWRRVN